MKVYFVASSTFYKTHPAEFDNIKKAIKEQGNEVYSLTDKKNTSESIDVAVLINQAEKLIKECDVMIAAGMQTSAGLGYDIAKAVMLKKPILILSKKGEEEGLPPHPIRTHSKQIVNAVYSADNLKKIVSDFMAESKKKLDTKFILIISPEIDRYLEWASEFRRMHKAQVVRESVEAVMKKDKEYKAYLNSQ